jgi:hypothetical protein
MGSEITLFMSDDLFMYFIYCFEMLNSIILFSYFALQVMVWAIIVHAVF